MPFEGRTTPNHNIMKNSKRPLIVVFGSTGRQGGSVVRYLTDHEGFRVRAITRNPSKNSGIADEVVYADLTKPETLDAALKDADGVFLVTDYWAKASTEDWAQTPVEEWSDPVDEFAQGQAVVEAARRAGVKHFVWSTLPNTMKISNGVFNIPYWIGKAKVDEIVSNAGFEHHSFVEAPFYNQNFLKEMVPVPQEDGTKAWNLPMRPDLKVMHMGDIDQMGAIVLGAFLNPNRAGHGQHLALAGGTYSWSDVVDIFNSLGHQVTFNQVPAEVFDGLMPGAKNLRHSLNYMEVHTYFGPEAKQKIELAKTIATEPLTPLEEWVKQNMP